MDHGPKGKGDQAKTTLTSGYSNMAFTIYCWKDHHLGLFAAMFDYQRVCQVGDTSNSARHVFSEWDV